MGGRRMQLYWFGDYQGHKMKSKFEFLGSAVIPCDCKIQFDMTAKIILALQDLKQENFFLIPLLEINF